MKRFLAMIVAMCSIIVAMAQHPMATLSHNGELTQFTGMHAIDAAYDAAKVGDIIYLSEGEFLSRDEEKLMHGGICIVGSGYNSKILCSLRFACYNDEEWPMAEHLNGVILDGVNVNAVSFDNMENREFAEIRNSWIGFLSSAGSVAKTFCINRCFIENATFEGYDNRRDVYVNNSKIKRLGEDSYQIQVKNCNILKALDCPRILINSIVADVEGEDGKFQGSGIHSVYNSLLPSEEIVNPDHPTTLHDCYFENPATGLLDKNLNATIDLQAKGYLGQDGTVIGAYGGDNPFSEYPSVPSIDSDKSSVEFDPTTNKLNVTITVASN